MHSLRNYTLAEPKRYSAKGIIKPIPFVCVAPDAMEVYLMGDFNDWDPQAHPMKRQPDGAWRLEVLLNYGIITTFSSWTANQRWIRWRGGSRAIIAAKRFR